MTRRIGNSFIGYFTYVRIPSKFATALFLGQCVVLAQLKGGRFGFTWSNFSTL